MFMYNIWNNFELEMSLHGVQDLCFDVKHYYKQSLDNFDLIFKF